MSKNTEKKFKQIQSRNDREIIKSERRIKRAKDEAMKELKSELADLYEEYGTDGALTKDAINKYNRMEKLEKKIAEIAQKSWRETNKEMTSQLRKSFTDTARETAVIVRDGVDKPFKSLNSISKSFNTTKSINNEMAGLVWRDRNKQHRDKLIYDINSTIKKGLSNGETYSTMARKLTEINNVDRNKANTIIRTETKRVINEAQRETLDKVKDAGVVMVKTWNTVNDERVRDSHADLDGVTIPYDDDFTTRLGNSGFGPQQLNDDGEDSINCRCFLTIDFTQEEKDEALRGEKEEVKEEVREDKVERSEFKEAETIKEAETYAQKELGIENVDYGKMDIHTANEWNRGLKESFEDFPELKENFGFVGDARLRNKAIKPLFKKEILDNLKKANPYISEAKLKPHADKMLGSVMRQMSVSRNTFAQSWSPSQEFLKGYRGVTVNPDYGKDAKRFIENIKSTVDSKFSPVSCDTIKAILDHEVGHQIDDLLGISDLKDIQDLFNSKTKEELKNGLSSYTYDHNNNKKYSEFIAEAWAEYRNNPEPREIATSVGRTIEKTYDKKFRK